METAILLPISRDTYLDAVFSRLELLSCDRGSTSLLCIVDGDVQLTVKARNFCEQSKFGSRLCVQYPQESSQPREHNLLGRRKRIADIHNFAKDYVNRAQFIFLTEDDTILPANTLDRLHEAYKMYPYAGLVSGVQLGRHGIPHIGAWAADDIYDPTVIQSKDQGIGTEEIDAAGFFATLTRSENYMAHEHKPFGNNDLGPDVYYGLELRKQGYKNYIEWSINTTHKRQGGDLSLHNTVSLQVTFTKVNNQWKQRIG